MREVKLGPMAKIENILASAANAAQAAKHANYIRMDVMPDRSAVVLTVHHNGKDGSWITYDAEQLDELIRLLQAGRTDLKP
jgi:hypothetical protein